METDNLEFENYYRLATEAWDNKEYLKAVSYIDICKLLNRTEEILTLRNTYIKAYLDSLKDRKYETNKVAVYAICKNERAFIERWYESMKEADYICVLDTGSTDGTFEALRDLSKKDTRVIVLQQNFSPWRFDIPRNTAMALVPEDANILLSTDLDEILESGWAEDLKSNWIEGQHERASYQYAWSHTASGANGRVFWYNKVHSWNWIWRFPVHELLYNLVTDSENYTQEKSITLNKMFLHHYPDSSKSRSSYLELLEQRAKEDEEDLYGLIYLAHEYNYRYLYQKSIDLLEKLVTLQNVLSDTLLTANCYLFMGDNYVALRNADKAAESYLKSIEADPTYREGYLSLAQLLVDVQKYPNAIYYVKQAIENSVRHYSWLERDISWTYQPYDILALAYFYSGDKVRSLAAAIEAARLEPAEKRLQDNVKLIRDAISEKDWSL